MPHAFVRLLPVLLLSVACVEPIGERGDGIINGAPAPGRTEVVAVANLSAGGLCSGTVIGPFAVLTAKHCVYEDRGDGVWVPLSPSSLLVLSATDVNTSAGIQAQYRVAEWRSTPGNYTDADLEEGDDIAVILLSEPVMDVTPRVVKRTLPSAGQAAELVGFGRSDPSTDESGVKLKTATTVLGANNRLVEAGYQRTGDGWTCQGDSGGPLFVSGQVAGVTSFGVGGCGNWSRHFFTAIPRHLAMIDAAVDWRPPCDVSEEICDGVDNDCDLEVDEVCTGLGEACTNDAECSDELCQMVSGEGTICVRACDPRSALPTCPFGFHCETTACFEGRCVPGAEGWIRDGDPCTMDSECLGNRCIEVVPGMRLCSRPCEVGGMPTCDEGTLCEDRGASCGDCVPVELSTTPRPYGAPCESDSQCESGDCTEGEGAAEGFCTRSCAAGECGEGRHCREGRCVGGDLSAPGQDCTVSDDCALMGDCVDVEGELLCALACADGVCSEGTVCEETDAGPRCIAEGAPLGSTCMDSVECRSGICAGTVCTRICDDTPCPEGFDCVPAGGTNACVVADDGGCAAGGSGHPFGGALVLAGLAVVLGRRRRSARG